MIIADRNTVEQLCHLLFFCDATFRGESPPKVMTYKLYRKTSNKRSWRLFEHGLQNHGV